MTGLVRTIAPTVTPVSLDEVKQHLRVSNTDQDSLITMYIKAATDYIDGKEGFLGRAIITQTWRLTLDGFPDSGQIKIPLPPLQAVTNVEYDDTNGNVQIVDPSTYFIDTASEPGWVVAETNSQFPTTLDAINTVRVDFVAGYSPDGGSPPDLTANVPFDLKAGLLLTIGSFFEIREEVTYEKAVTQIPFGADILFRRHKINKSMA